MLKQMNFQLRREMTLNLCGLLHGFAGVLSAALRRRRHQLTSEGTVR